MKSLTRTIAVLAVTFVPFFLTGCEDPRKAALSAAIMEESRDDVFDEADEKAVKERQLPDDIKELLPDEKHQDVFLDLVEESLDLAKDAMEYRAECMADTVVDDVSSGHTDDEDAEVLELLDDLTKGKPLPVRLEVLRRRYDVFDEAYDMCEPKPELTSKIQDIESKLDAFWKEHSE